MDKNQPQLFEDKRTVTKLRQSLKEVKRFWQHVTKSHVVVRWCERAARSEFILTLRNVVVGVIKPCPAKRSHRDNQTLDSSESQAGADEYTEGAVNINIKLCCNLQ